MKLTPELLRATYDMLVTTQPFHKWNLPPSEDVKFVVTRDHDMGSHARCGRGKESYHELGISSKRIGTLQPLIPLMAHEMIHLYISHHNIRDTSAHGKVFRKLLQQVCKSLGYDEKELWK